MIPLLIDLGPHAAFIWASYAAVIAVIAALLIWLLATGRSLAKQLADLEARGIRRRSDRTEGGQA